ncbi:hypothetical protein [Halodesulfurarchaeum formicicum]|uniref:hypothetical protein n=1 Tax=Halodesulfurarchaeum formicicum TaxID=1873524 RepID=UPI0013141F72|nr:hypothetical protein [Halodesulfurarchaeum formicicum]
MSDPTVSDSDVVTRHRAKCESCGREETAGGSMEEYDRLENEFADHIDDGTACHGFSIWAVYKDGGEERVI